MNVISYLFNSVGEVLMKQATDIGDLEIILHKAPSQLISKEVLPFLANYWAYYSGWAALESTENHQFYATGKIYLLIFHIFCYEH